VAHTPAKWLFASFNLQILWAFDFCIFLLADSNSAASIPSASAMTLMCWIEVHRVNETIKYLNPEKVDLEPPSLSMHMRGLGVVAVENQARI
jgi:hypothetical protein